MKEITDPFLVCPEDLAGAWVEMENRSLFHVSGPDAERFLNGQVSNDVRRATKEQAIAACLCTVKGKVEALVWISRDDDGFLVDGQGEQREAIHARLERYLIADDCEIADRSEEIRLIHHFGEGIGGQASERCAVAGRDLWLPRNAQIPLPEEERIRIDSFDDLQLAAGFPAHPFEIDGDSFPAELGLNRRAVEFRKGCYLGQETISRIESVGRIRRRCSLIRGNVSWAQGATVRNSEGELGVATRPSKRFSSGKFAGFAWLPSKEDSTQIVDVEEVA